MDMINFYGTIVLTLLITLFQFIISCLIDVFVFHEEANLQEAIQFNMFFGVTAFCLTYLILPFYL